MQNPLTIGQMLAVQGRLFPDRIGVRDLDRAMTFRHWNERARRLANALLGLGLAKGDRVAVLAYNRIEWAEIYVATAKAGLIAVPINFRLVGPEIAYILGNAGAAALIVEDALAGAIEEIRAGLAIPPGRLIHLGAAACPAGFHDYEALIAAAADREPDQSVTQADPWTLMYTSGTTGRPKGVLRSHKAAVLLGFVTAIEFALHRDDAALLVMPMCHANSLNFFGAFAYCGATTAIYSRRSFDPEHCLRALAETGASFTSLVPTHYIMLLGLAEAVWARHDPGRVAKLLISSAPARPDTKREVMARFPNSGLFEMYGSSEAGWVTVLRPHEQFTKLGSVGRECVGAAPIRLLDPDGNEVADGVAGELYSCNPHSFDRYWEMADKTAEAFRGEYCTVGDMARRDADGYIQLVDRKSNMIISGGENIYPSEVEAVLGAHPAVQDVAVIGLPDAKWGERVHAVIIPRPGAAPGEAELLEWCKDRIAGYKRPRSCTFLHADQVPRTATGKILHRVLKTQLTGGRDPAAEPSKGAKR